MAGIKRIWWIERASERRLSRSVKNVISPRPYEINVIMIVNYKAKNHHLLFRRLTKDIWENIEGEIEGYHIVVIKFFMLPLPKSGLDDAMELCVNGKFSLWKLFILHAQVIAQLQENITDY